MTGPVEFLQAAHAQAEKTADRLQSELWWIGNVGRIEAYSASGGVRFVDGRVNGQTVTVTEAIQRGLLAGNPEDLLRRVAAERKELARHKPTGADFDGTRLCLACGGYTIHPGLGIRGYRDPWPCATIRNLAEGWGWQEEQHG